MKNMKMKNTKLFVVLDEATLNTMKGKGGKTAKFSTAREADWAAANRLMVWSVIEVNFNHPFISHSV